MPRLTRAQRQEQTRAELLDAAKARFLKHGYASTSLDDIADDAGYSKGAVYSNFGSKPILCREVLEAIHREKFAEMSELATSDADIPSRVEAVNAWLERTAGDVGWTMLELEFVVLSRNDPELGQMITALRNDAGQMVVEVLRSLSVDTGLGEEQLVAAGVIDSFDDVGNLFLSAGIGLGIQRAVDPTLPARPVTGAITRLMNLVTALGAMQG
ncbi:TetR/AcrR family transcriptional regulator [Mycobacterium sp. CBMA293]|uniref:TetR/AcrR family transcriptional regulator n=1 Tax=unclassified Mycolicibacterium TaxID=2636767 RepID=UPI0012DCE1FE|nr:MULTISPECIES: TetR/AcrR family transcriptional regulator [unclassified Mycolicibacterium]MUL45613.1 TetR/AcrR family transcriptional regulator [Mycolicibacterium sp. CBMA 360]MUL60283.1 TetR/AcrR family transcriptional regulator [Mycolicibacterium sp. CBMA 335]MUL71505.1 TetR/AcrR family transcriptional regulator [Mycolicibacterium sp. CBMA 311]MUL73070.1 TetR/AcrR family transcriptional regulator [Mycolicibacterium sp. CBMA 311]MUL95955.1 TetR/AcrR family transcriptional regulator [Mycolic